MSATRWAPAIAGALVLASATASAAGPEPPSIVVWNDAPDVELSSLLASRLRTTYVVRAAGPLGKSLASARAPSLAAAEKDRGKDAQLVGRARQGARAIHADTVVLVRSRRSKRATVVHVWLVDARGEGSATVDRDVPLGPRATVAEEADAVWGVIGPELQASRTHETDVAAAPLPSSTPPAPSAPALAVAPAEASPAAPDAAEGPRPTPESRGATRAHALAFVRVQMEAGTRHFSYVDPLTTTLRSYDLAAAPLVAIDAEVYPLARTGVPVLDGLGVTFDYALAFALSSTDSAGTAVTTAWSSFDAGVRERLAVGRVVTLGLHGGYGEIVYSFHGALDATAELPDVHYRFVRGGIDACAALSRISFCASGGYLGVLSTGTFGTYFPRATVGGVEGQIGLAYALGHGFEVSFEVGYTRFFYTLNPEPGDAYVAGGALDQWARGALGVGYLF